MKRILLWSLLTGSLLAQWSNDPAQALNLGSGIQPQIAATADGGAYVAWLSEGSFHIYLQRLDPAGIPQWDTGGLLISDAANSSWIAVFHLNLAVDGEGNAILTSVDTRTGVWAVYAWKVSPAGEMLWNPSGLMLSGLGTENISPRLAVWPDNSVIVTWTRDYNSVSLQRIDADGSLLWPAGGLSWSVATGNLMAPLPVILNTDEVLVQAIRQTGTFPAVTSSVLVMKFDQAGNMLWESAAVAGGPASFPLGNWVQDMCLDGSGGSYHSWTEMTAQNQTVKLQHVSADGVSSWAAPTELSQASTHFRTVPRLAVAPGCGEAMAAWTESDADQSDRGITAQRLTISGTRQWGNEGIAVAPLGRSSYLDLHAGHFDEDLVTLFLESGTAGETLKAARLDSAGDFVWAPGIRTLTSPAAARTDLSAEFSPNWVMAVWSENGQIRTHCLGPDGSLGAPELPPGQVLWVPENYATIQEAIEAAYSQDTIVVSAGTYFENIDFLGKELFITSVGMYTNDTLPSPGPVIDGGGAGAVVTFQGNEGLGATLQGFAIQNGGGNLADPDGDGSSAHYGGGICCEGASPTLRNLSISFNHAEDGGGGGLFCYAASPNLSGIQFISNTSGDVGGGLYAKAQSNLVLDSCLFAMNSAPDVGGAIYARDSSNLVITNSRFGGNMSDHAGAALGFKAGCRPLLNRVTITENLATHFGGAIYCNSSHPVVVNSILWNNGENEVHFANSDDPSNITFAYSDLMGGLGSIETSDNGTVHWLEGNIDFDPFFERDSTWALQPDPHSPCRDRGTGFFSLDGDTLVDLEPDTWFGPALDMGWHEIEYGIFPGFMLEPEQVWTYATDEDTLTITVMADSMGADGRWVRTNHWTSADDATWFRVDGNRVLALADTGAALMYDFLARWDAAWPTPAPGPGLSVTWLSRANDMVITALDTFSNCKAFMRYIGTDLSFEEWFAPGLGLVQRKVLTQSGVAYYTLIDTGTTVAMEENTGTGPSDFCLYPATPNPFNATTTLRYEVPAAAWISLKVFNLQGQEIEVLENGFRPAGMHSLTWESGTTASGIYFIRLDSETVTRTEKCLLLK